ncbi:AraC family transcriptional regulator ligand-binding domain-containing protein [Mobilibacterium timonense]|uniref:AraC family transcriptional regulator n=1 Tax=Mobilibacterium timonense TaxID=1871012 RepID=UPI003A93561D
MNHFVVDGRYEDLLKYFGLDPEAVLKKARLPEDTFRRKIVTMKEEEYYRFMEAIGKLSTDSQLPINMSTVNQIESFSPPIFASWCSRNGEICIDRLTRYKKLIGPMRFLVSKEEDQETIRLVPGDETLEIPSFLVQSEFAFLIGMFRRATHEDINPMKISMTELPKDDSFADFAGIAPEHGEENYIVFSRKDLNEPFISFNDAMWSYFEPELAKRLAEVEVDDSVSARVRSALTELLPGGAGTIEDMAEKLGMSRRTLQRKLSQEDTTFQKQLNNTREILAIHYIRNTDMTTNDMAYLLGYAELNSFLRAFTVWTGKSITEYRKELEKEEDK